MLLVTRLKACTHFVALLGQELFSNQSTHQSTMRGKIIQTDDELIFFLVNECSRSSRITSMNKQITSENILKTVSEC